MRLQTKNIDRTRLRSPKMKVVKPLGNISSIDCQEKHCEIFGNDYFTALLQKIGCRKPVILQMIPRKANKCCLVECK